MTTTRLFIRFHLALQKILPLKNWLFDDAARARTKFTDTLAFKVLSKFDEFHCDPPLDLSSATISVLRDSRDVYREVPKMLDRLFPLICANKNSSSSSSEFKVQIRNPGAIESFLRAKVGVGAFKTLEMVHPVNMEEVNTVTSTLLDKLSQVFEVRFQTNLYLSRDQTEPTRCTRLYFAGSMLTKP